MGALALASDEAEVLDRAGAGGAEPVRGAGVELGGLTGLQDQVLVAEHQAEGAVQHIGPIEPFVGAQVRGRVIAAPGEDELVGLDASGATGERDDDRPVAAGQGAEVDSGVGGARRIDEGVEGDAVVAGQREQLFQSRPPQPRLQPREGARGDPGLLSERGERDVASQSKVLQAWPHRVEGLIVFAHALDFAIRQERLPAGPVRAILDEDITDEQKDGAMGFAQHQSDEAAITGGGSARLSAACRDMMHAR